MRHVAVILTLLAVACKSEPPRPGIPPGEARLAVPGGHIWYNVTGAGAGTPVVLLHGGPGFSSFYLKPFEALGNDRVVIRYDQLGGGKSDTTSDTTMFTIGHFVAELDSLRAHLGIAQWHVVGHSWGTILALEYYRAHAEHVASLTFGSPVFDIPAYERRATELIATLPDSSQRAIRRAVARNEYESPAYLQALDEFYNRYLWRHPQQPDLDSTMNSFNQSLYVYMQGPSEFTITGTLKRYQSTDFLPQVRVPALVTVGEFDEVGPELVRGHAALIPGARYEVIAGAAHMTPWDGPEQNVRVVRAFLNHADSAATRP